MRLSRVPRKERCRFAFESTRGLSPYLWYDHSCYPYISALFLFLIIIAYPTTVSLKVLGAMVDAGRRRRCAGAEPRRAPVTSMKTLRENLCGLLRSRGYTLVPSLVPDRFPLRAPIRLPSPSSLRTRGCQQYRKTFRNPLLRPALRWLITVTGPQDGRS